MARAATDKSPACAEFGAPAPVGTSYARCHKNRESEWHKKVEPPLALGDCADQIRDSFVTAHSIMGRRDSPTLRRSNHELCADRELTRQITFAHRRFRNPLPSNEELCGLDRLSPTTKEVSDRSARGPLSSSQLLSAAPILIPKMSWRLGPG